MCFPPKNNAVVRPENRQKIVVVLVEQVLRGYANKLLHEPLVQIREFANDDDGYLRLDTVRRLFKLDDEEQDA